MLARVDGNEKRSIMYLFQIPDYLIKPDFEGKTADPVYGRFILTILSFSF